MRFTHNYIRAAWFVLPLALGLAACGGGSDEAADTIAPAAPPTTVEATTTTAEATTTTVVAVKPVIQEAAVACNLGHLVADRGTTLALTGGTIDDLRCLRKRLQIPVRVMNAIGSTRALDGTQQDSWDDLQARWTYHPDDGLDLTISIEES